MNCTEQALPTEADSELSKVEQTETASVTDIGKIRNTTGETVTLRNVFEDHVEVEDVENGGTVDIRSTTIEMIAYNDEAIELTFNEVTVKSVSSYYNQELNGETVNITRLIFDNSVPQKSFAKCGEPGEGDCQVEVVVGDDEEN